jgi:tRNA pseudouridine55 synthase
VDGILVIDKPEGITSHDVVSRVRRILKTKRVGHTGTLDPFATGVMVILVGQATRLAQFLDKDQKDYEATMKFGFETDTGDGTGTRRGDAETPGRSDRVTTQQIESALANFRGDIEQMPPMYSAKKVDGKKLYEHARKGETIERKPVKVSIHNLELLESADTESSSDTVRIRVACSAGTYIRTLAEDIGRKLGVGAHLTELRRTRAGKFAIGQSQTLDELQAMPEPSSALIPMNDAVEHLPKFTVAANRVDKTRNGLSTRVFDTGLENGEMLRMVAESGELIAIGRFNSDENVVQPKVVLV